MQSTVNIDAVVGEKWCSWRSSTIRLTYLTRCHADSVQKTGEIMDASHKLSTFTLYSYSLKWTCRKYSSVVNCCVPGVREGVQCFEVNYLDNDLARAVVVDDLELPDVAWTSHRIKTSSTCKQMYHENVINISSINNCIIKRISTTSRAQPKHRPVIIHYEWILPVRIRL